METYIRTTESWRGWDWTGEKKVRKYSGSVVAFRQVKDGWICERGLLDGDPYDPGDWAIDTIHLLTEEEKDARIARILTKGFRKLGEEKRR